MIGLYLYLKRVDEAHAVERSVQLVKERFYSNMSHEIRTPLNAIYGLSEVIRETSGESFTRESAETISKSAFSLSEMLTDALLLSEDAVQNGPPACELFDANELLDEVLAPLLPVAEEKYIHLRCEPLPAEEATVFTNKQHLRQIIWNLALNAVKFTENGVVSLRLYYEEGALCFRCADTGIGIEEGFQKHLFEAFTQEDDSSKRQYEGAGLGLAIVKRSVDALGGKISLRSEKGKGATFWIKLPLRSST